MENKIIVIDIGSETCKFGFANDSQALDVPCIIGKPKSTIGGGSYVGHKAFDNRFQLNLKYLLQRGKITNCYEMEDIFSHIYKQLNVEEPKEHPVLLTEMSLDSKKNRELLANIMFNTFDVPSLYIAKPPVLSLYASGRLAGTVLDSGYGLSRIVSVYDGYALQNATEQIELSGQDLTEYLKREVQTRNRKWDNYFAPGNQIAKAIKEGKCYVALDFENETKINSSRNTFTLPDGQKVDIGCASYYCPEILFQPSLDNKHSKINGIHECIHDSIMNSDSELRKILYENIILSGGSTMFTGMEERLEKELDIIRLEPNVNIRVAKSESIYSTWSGGCMIAPLYQSLGLFVTREEYQDNGTSILDRKWL